MPVHLSQKFFFFLSVICAISFFSFVLHQRFTAHPPAIAVMSATSGLRIAKGIPSKDAVANIESTPVCGVAIRNDTVAPFDAQGHR